MSSSSGKSGKQHTSAAALESVDPVARDLDVARAVFADEIEGLRQIGSQIDESFHAAAAAIDGCSGRLIVSGVGKSGLIGKKIAATFTSTGTPCFYIHPVEAAHGDLGLVSPNDVLLFISKSGVSDEFRQLYPSLEKLGVIIIALTGTPDSYLARHSDIVLNCRVDHEACTLDLAPTTSATGALVMGDALACALMKRRGFRVEDFARNHPSGILGKRLTLRVRDLMRTGDRVPLVRVGTSLKDALLEMISKSIGCVGVQDESGRLCGIITDGDLKRILIREPNALEQPANPAKPVEPVETFMTRDPKMVDADSLAADALNAMEMNPAGPLTMFFIVDEDGRPTGVLHMHDILKAGLGDA